MTLMDRVVSEYMAQGPFLLVARFPGAIPRPSGWPGLAAAPGHGRDRGSHNVGGGRDGFKANVPCAPYVPPAYEWLAYAPPGASSPSTFSSGRRVPSGWID